MKRKRTLFVSSSLLHQQCPVCIFVLFGFFVRWEVSVRTITHTHTHTHTHIYIYIYIRAQTAQLFTHYWKEKKHMNDFSEMKVEQLRTRIELGTSFPFPTTLATHTISQTADVSGNVTLAPKPCLTLGSAWWRVCWLHSCFFEHVYIYIYIYTQTRSKKIIKSYK